MKLFDRAKALAVRKIADLVQPEAGFEYEPEPPPASAPKPVDKRYVEQFSAETEVEQLRRKCDEYFRVVEMVMKERDEWQKRFREHLREHTVAQQMYERDLVKARKAAGVLLTQLNKMRIDADLKPIVLQRPEDIEPIFNEPFGIVDELVNKHLEQLANLDGAFAALEARKRIE